MICFYHSPRCTGPLTGWTHGFATVEWCSGDDDYIGLMCFLLPWCAFVKTLWPWTDASFRTVMCIRAPAQYPWKTCGNTFIGKSIWHISDISTAISCLKSVAAWSWSIFPLNRSSADIEWFCRLCSDKQHTHAKVVLHFALWPWMAWFMLLLDFIMM